MNFIKSKTGIVIIILILVFLFGLNQTGVFGETRISISINNNPDLENGLVGHWTFDGNYVDWASTTAEIIDRSNYGNNGDATSLSTDDISYGVIGQGLVWAGSADYVKIASTTELTPSSPYLTMSVWIKPEDYVPTGTNNWRFFIHASGNLNDKTGYAMGFDGTGTDLELTIGDGVTRSALSIDETLAPLHEWTHVVGVVDTTNFYLYINGVEKNSAAHGRASIVYGLYDVYLGTLAYAAGGNYVVNGGMDDIRIYDRPLSEAEINRLYDLGATTHINTTINNNPDLENGLVGHWTFDGKDTDFSAEVGAIIDTAGSNDGDAYFGSEGGTVTSCTGATTTTYITSGSSWTVPTDWCDTDNSVEVIGGGGGGDSGSNGAGGGGGGAYSYVVDLDLTPDASVTIGVGSGGAISSDGGDTWFNAATYVACADSGVCASAEGGTGATGLTGAAGGTTGGIGLTENAGGTGGEGTAVGNDSAGGGGGSGGPNGTGADGGDGDLLDSAGHEGSGGGGGGGGGSTGTAGDADGGAGGNNHLGAGSGAAGAGDPGPGGIGSDGGGGGGADGRDGSYGGDGGPGIDWDATHGSGGGGGGGEDRLTCGGGSDNCYGGDGGLYGGGGGGGEDGGVGAQGIIVVSYIPESTTAALGTATTTTTGAVGQALEFDGVDDEIQFGDVLDIGLSDRTLSAWFKTSSSSIQVIAGKGYSITSTGAKIYLNAGIVSAQLANNSGTGDILAQSIDTFNDDKWHLATAVYDRDGNLTLYVDSVLVDTEDLSSLSAIDSNNVYDFQIGVLNVPTVERYFDGSIDDVRVYDRTLSAAEIARLYELGATTHINTSIDTVDDLEDGLVAHWTYDGMYMDTSSTTAEVIDRTGNGNSGDWTNHDNTKQPGVIGQAIDLIGDDEYIDAGNGPTINSISTAVTAATWFQVDAIESAIFVTNSRDCCGSYKGYQLDIRSGGTGRFVLWDEDDVGRSVETNTTFTAGRWYHYVGTYDGDVLRVYVDGVEDNTSDIPDVVIGTPASYNLHIGRLAHASSWHLNGRMDDTRIYNRALSADEILRLYQLGN